MLLKWSSEESISQAVETWCQASLTIFDASLEKSVALGHFEMLTSGINNFSLNFIDGFETLTNYPSPDMTAFPPEVRITANNLSYTVPSLTSLVELGVVEFPRIDHPRFGPSTCEPMTRLATPY